MARRKSAKILLCICEGESDREALEFLLTSLFDALKVRVRVYGGDITTRFDSDEIKAELGNFIQTAIQDPTAPARLRESDKSDIGEVVYLGDTDGCFISDDKVVRSDVTLERTIYHSEAIETDNPNGICARNKQKSRNMKLLYSTKKVVKKFPFSAYFCSCNLDHVISENPNVESSQKVENAKDFSDSYFSDPFEFISFLDRDLLPKEVAAYRPSWEYIQKGTNSLHRHTHLICLLIDRYHLLKPEAQQKLKELGYVLDSEND